MRTEARWAKSVRYVGGTRVGPRKTRRPCIPTRSSRCFFAFDIIEPDGENLRIAENIVVPLNISHYLGWARANSRSNPCEVDDSKIYHQRAQIHTRSIDHENKEIFEFTQYCWKSCSSRSSETCSLWNQLVGITNGTSGLKKRSVHHLHEHYGKSRMVL